MPAANVSITATLGSYDVTLYDGTHDPTNATTIAANDDYIANVTLSGRTLYKDGDWNTLCLPFDIDDFSGTPLEDATVMELDVDGYYDITNNNSPRYVYDSYNKKYVSVFYFLFIKY